MDQANSKITAQIRKQNCRRRKNKQKTVNKTQIGTKTIDTKREKRCHVGEKQDRTTGREKTLPK